MPEAEEKKIVEIDTSGPEVNIELPEEKEEQDKKPDTPKKPDKKPDKPKKPDKKPDTPEKGIQKFIGQTP